MPATGRLEALLGRLRTESYSRGIVLSSILNGVAQVVGFLTNVALAYYYGTQTKVDVYYYCFSVIMIISAFAGNINASVLIPESMHFAESHGREYAARFVNFFLYLCIAAGLAVCLLMYIDPVASFTAVSSFDVAALERHSLILKLSIPLFCVQMTAMLLMDVVSSRKFFVVPALCNIGTRVMALAALVLLHARLDIAGVLVGNLIAGLAQVVLLVVIMRHSLKWDFSFRWLKIESRILRNIVMTQAGSLISTFALLVPIYMFTGMAAGQLSGFNYAHRLLNLPIVLIIAQASSVMAIKFNEAAARRDYASLNAAFTSACSKMVFVLVPVSVAMAVFAREITMLVFMRGQFDESSVEVSAWFLKWLAMLLPFLGVNTLVARLFMAGRRIAAGSIYEASLGVVLAAGSYVCMKMFGSSGYVGAVLCFHGMNVLAVYWLIRYAFPFVTYGVVLRRLVMALGFGIVSGVALFWLKGVVTMFARSTWHGG